MDSQNEFVQIIRYLFFSSTTIAAVGAIINFRMLHHLFNDAQSRSWNDFLRHAGICVAASAICSAWACADPGWEESFLMTFLFLMALPIGTMLLGAFFLLTRGPATTSASSGSGGRESVFYLPDGTTIELVRSGGGYVDYDGHPYRVVSGDSVEPVPEHLETADGQWVYVSFRNGYYYDAGGNRYRMYGGRLERS